MFDAKSLFEMMVRGAQPSQSPVQRGMEGADDLGDLLRQLTQGQQGGGQGGQGGLGDILSNMFPNQGQSGGSGSGSFGSPFGGSTGGGSAPQVAPGGGQGGGQGGGLGDILGQLQNQAGGGAGGLADILGKVFQQGADGVKEGAGRLSEQPGMREFAEKIGGGRDPESVLQQLQDFLANNKVATGAALGGLGALVFGTSTGRSLASSAAKLGALALVGGLAYKAYRNYSAGQAPDASSIAPEAAPAGTGFDEGSVSNDAAQTYIRGMIAAAASDGRLDATEQQRIIGSLSGQGLDAQAEEFLAYELNNPASIDDLVAGVRTQEEAMQLYTAARVAIEPDTSAEQQFLAVLAGRLGIDDNLRAHIDAATRGAAA